MANHETVNRRRAWTFTLDTAPSSKFNQPIEGAVGDGKRVMQHAKPSGDRTNRIKRSRAPWLHHRPFAWERGGHHPLRLVISPPFEHLRDRMPMDCPLQPDPLMFKIESCCARIPFYKAIARTKG